MAFPSNSRGRSPEEDDGLRISSSHLLFSHFYSYCRACKCSGTCAPSNHLHCHKDGLWLRGDTAEGGLWHIPSSSTSPSITLIRLHFGLLSVKKIHCESDIKTSRAKRGSHCAAHTMGTAAGPNQSHAPILQQWGLCGVEAGWRCWGCCWSGVLQREEVSTCPSFLSSQCFSSQPLFQCRTSHCHKKTFFFIFFSPRQWYLKALKAATFLCFGFVPFFLLLALCPALQMRCLFSPLSYPTYL